MREDKRVRKHIDQRGAVSLISVVIFATIITILITAYLRAAVSQRSEALSYDFSTRAYYAAESGVQDAVRYAESNPGDKTDCNPDPTNTGLDILGGQEAFGLSYTCQLIKFNPDTLTGSVQPNNGSVTLGIDPEDDAIANPRLVVRWSQRFENADIVSGEHEALVPRVTSDPKFPPIEQWRAGGTGRAVHALLRTAVVSHPDGAFTRDQIKQRVVFMNPTTAANADTSPAKVSEGDNVGEQQEELMHNATCYSNNKNDAIPAGENMKNYSCKATIQLTGYNFGTQKVYIHVGAVYKSADFSVELVDATGASVPLKNSQYIVDVTGKAGTDTFRRIKQTIKLGDYGVTSDLDAALVAGDGICKQFVLRADTTQYDQGCDPLAAP